MARKVQVHLLDDIDGSQADETLKFALDGTNYEIDLSTKHADKLRSVLGLTTVNYVEKPGSLAVVDSTLE